MVDIRTELQSPAPLSAYFPFLTMFVACMRDKRHAYRILVRKPEEEGQQEA
jgi:hypothetical protein